MEKILLLTDSGSDLTLEVAEKYGIRICPFKYTFDGNTYFADGVDKTVEEFYEMERSTPDPPKTAQITPIEMTEIYNKAYAEGYNRMIFTVLSSSGSGTYQNACMMAESFMEEHEDVKIELIDSQAFTIVYGFAVIEGAKALKGGASFEGVISRIKEVLAGASVRFVVNDLTYLKKGGRINMATLVVANMLDIKPVLTLKGGLVVADTKLRGTKNLNKKFVEDMAKKVDFSKGTATIVHTCIEDKAAQLREAFNQIYPDVKVNLWTVGATIGSHAGPDLVGIAHFDDTFEV